MRFSIDIRTCKTCTTRTSFANYSFTWRLAFKDTNNVDDVQMENNSNFSQFRPYFRVLDREDDNLDHAVMYLCTSFPVLLFVQRKIV